MAEGFELDIITTVLLGGVSIFGGKGNLVGVGLSLLVILNLRNGMGLADITGNTQNDVIGVLLILSVLVPNIISGQYKTNGKGENDEKISDGRRGAAALWRCCRKARGRQDAMATPGKDVSMVLLPKFLGILPFDQAHKGAEEAAKELKNPAALQFLGPTPQNSVAGQIEIVTNATTQGVKAIMISNNSGDQIVPAAKAARPRASRSSPGTRRFPPPRARTCSSPRSTSTISARSWPT
jgi:hypothetical protein